MAHSSSQDRSKLPLWADPTRSGSATRASRPELPGEFWRTIVDTLRVTTADLRRAD